METTETHSGLHDFTTPFLECQNEHINELIGSFRELACSLLLKLETSLVKALKEAHTILTLQVIRNPSCLSKFHSDFDNFVQVVNDLSGAGLIYIFQAMLLQNIRFEPAVDETMTDNNIESLLFCQGQVHFL